MANPRVFLSSTYYDMKHIRNDLENFISKLGYEPVMNERGDIPYGKEEKLEKYCYREISNCDIFINIIGGRFGSTSENNRYSISQMELKKAHELNKQIYIFVDKSVHVEYRTYLDNRENNNFKPSYVDDIRVYEFLEEVYNYPTNNSIQNFESVKDIIIYLREQWAGLFQRLLQEESQKEHYKISENLKSTAQTLSQLIEYTTKERDETIKKILVYGHPVFTEIKQATNIPIRIFFTDLEELHDLLTNFDYERNIMSEDEKIIYTKSNNMETKKLFITKEIFDENDKLQPVDHGEWEGGFVDSKIEQHISVEDEELDVPF